MKRVAAAIAALAVVGILAGGAALVFGGSSEAKTVVVPGIRSGGVLFAFDRMRSLGLRVAIPERTQFGPMSSPTVRQQQPAGGASVDRGSVVTLELTGGLIGSPAILRSMPVYRVPDFRGKSLTEAIRWTKGKYVYWETDLPPLPASSAKHLFDAYEVKSQKPDPGSAIRQGIRIPNGIRLTPLTLEVELR